MPSKITFVGEQDGNSERILKERIKSYFVRNRIKCRAYLAKVKYGASAQFSIALCLYLRSTEPPSLRRDVGDIFADLFRTDEHLDTIAIRFEQENDLVKVCDPFFDGFDE